MSCEVFGPVRRGRARDRARWRPQDLTRVRLHAVQRPSRRRQGCRCACRAGKGVEGRTPAVGGCLRRRAQLERRLTERRRLALPTRRHATGPRLTPRRLLLLRAGFRRALWRRFGLRELERVHLQAKVVARSLEVVTHQAALAQFGTGGRPVPAGCWRKRPLLDVIVANSELRVEEAARGRSPPWSRTPPARVTDDPRRSRRRERFGLLHHDHPLVGFAEVRTGGRIGSQRTRLRAVPGIAQHNDSTED